MRRTQLGIAFFIGAAVIILAVALARTRTARAAATVQAADAAAIYAARCGVCHGAQGDGNGPAAANLDPKPRDFRRGWYKIRATASGQLPTDADLVHVIANGMPGSTMPAWKGILTDEEMTAVANYLKSFSRRFEREKPQAISTGPRVESSEASIGRGQELYGGQQAECVKCHGNAGRGDGPSADELTDDFGNVIVPADLTMPWLFRGGPTADAIYLRLKTGLTGSPMPSYADVLSDEQLWDLANYVHSLSLSPPGTAPEPKAAITAVRAAAAIPADPNAAEWQKAKEYFYPLVGQIMREPRHYTPTINGVWVRALFNDSELALRLTWHDRFQNAGGEGQPADALAVQFPAQLTASDERPYFVFGDADHPVNLWYWSAAANATEERTGRGVNSVTAQATQNVRGAATFADGEYTLILRRALSTGDPEDIPLEPGRFIPVAFMAWDGWRSEQGAAGAVSSWYLIYLEKPVPAGNYVWIPVAMIGASLLEWWIVRAVRRSNAGRAA